MDSSNKNWCLSKATGRLKIGLSTNKSILQQTTLPNRNWTLKGMDSLQTDSSKTKDCLPRTNQGFFSKKRLSSKTVDSLLARFFEEETFV